MDKIEQAYRLLGITNGVSLGEVRRAYRLLAKKYHPDSNPGSGDKMMRINDAYQTIKEHLARDGSRKGETFPGARQNHVDNVRVYEMWRRSRSEQAARERYLREEELKRQSRREQEAWARWWEKRLEERQREEEDLKAYTLVVKHTFGVLNELYEQRLHYPHIRERPMGSIAYETFLGKYGVLVEKSGKLSRTARSKRYREKFELLLEFLEIFLEYLEDAKDIKETSSSALHRFGEVAHERDRFLGLFFSELRYDRDGSLEALKKILGSFEEFIRQYPASPLVFNADLSVDLLRRLYNAFLKE
jgi:curved DNA-binding protein CbpA